jgi:transcriptional regulator with XRE-family HTH domain
MVAATTRHPGGGPRSLDRCQLGQQIERLASNAGLHLDEVAEAAGIAMPTLNRICTGRIRSPRLATVKAIASALGVKVDRLLVG